MKEVLLLKVSRKHPQKKYLNYINKRLKVHQHMKNIKLCKIPRNLIIKKAAKYSINMYLMPLFSFLVTGILEL